MSILSILRLGAGPHAKPDSRTEPTVDVAARAYPPVDPGVQVRPVEDILAAHQDLISRYATTHKALTGQLPDLHKNPQTTSRIYDRNKVVKRTSL